MDPESLRDSCPRKTSPRHAAIRGKVARSPTCPHCHYAGPFNVDDKLVDDENSLLIKHWSPHEIEIVDDYYSGQTQYLWRIPEHYKAQVRSGYMFHLENVPLPVLEAIKTNKFFRFDDDAIFHLKEPTLAGLINRGWGIPRVFSNYRQMYYVQVLRRYNEAIALDYVIPFRLLTPMGRSMGTGTNAGMSDPLMQFSGGDVMSMLGRMINKRRKDPAAWNVLPFPVQYSMLGGDAKALAPESLLNQGIENMLNDLGTPIELFKGTLQLQAAPVSLRLFEAQWYPMQNNANRLLNWVDEKAAEMLGWESIKHRYKRPTLADDINKQMADLQLMMGGQMSGTTAFSALGKNWRQEQRQLASEQKYQMTLQQEVQKEIEEEGLGAAIAAGQAGPGGAPMGGPGGAPAPGGMPAPTGAQPGMPGAPSPVISFLQEMQGGAAISPDELIARAESIAQELLGMPEGQKDSDLRLLKQKNETMHSLVRAALDRIRRQARQQGGQQVMQQQFGVAR